VTLDEYRRRQKLTLEQLAELLGIPYGTVKSLVYRDRLPSIPVAARIETATDGAVGLRDWRTI